MIISHKHKFIFAAVPKVAGHAIRRALRPYMGEDDLEQVGLFKRSRFPYKELEHISHGHIKCTEIKEILGDEIWSEYYKIAFVRNPWDRYISSCFFKYRRSYKFNLEPHKYLRQIVEKEKYKGKIHFEPQSEFFFDENDRSMIDYIGRYESLESDLKQMMVNIGLIGEGQELHLEKVNSSLHDYYTQYYDKELIELVGELYSRDINNLEYIFE